MSVRTATIRTLRADEPIPAGEPRRYKDGRGYVRLRWLVGHAEYVEEYEHRLVAGRPDAEVHHLNGNKADNGRENLLILTKEEHARLHGSTAERKYAPYRSRAAMAEAQQAERNRQLRRERAEQMAALYREGFTTPEIAARFGIHASTVNRALHDIGTPMKEPAAYLPDIDRDLVRALHAQGVRAGAMMRRLGIGRRRLHQVFDELGLPRFAPGRP